MKSVKTTFKEVVNLDHSSEILEWRNDETTRLNSINQNIVSNADHIKWLSSKISSKDTILLLHFYKSEPCGLIKLDNLGNNSFGISINLNPQHRGKKLSTLIIKSSLHYLINKVDQPEIKVLASIKPSNTPSIKSFERSGFEKLNNNEPENLLLFSKSLLKIENILFLGYSDEETNLIKFLKDKGFNVVHENSKLNQDKLKDFDLTISYGYRHILTKDQLDLSTQPPINLHISYLPYNRGSHPNFWAFYEDTPHGITIHNIDSGIDTGSIMLQKKIDLSNEMSFKHSYEILRKQIELLFKENIDDLLYSTLKKYKNDFEGTFHQVKDLPDNVDWNLNINQYKKLNT